MYSPQDSTAPPIRSGERRNSRRAELHDAELGCDEETVQQDEKERKEDEQQLLVHGCEDESCAPFGRGANCAWIGPAGVDGEKVVEPRGIEPLTSAVRLLRSPS